MHEARPAMNAAVDAVETAHALQELLGVLCEITGIGFAVVARRARETWTAVAVHDTLGHGTRSGQALDAGAVFCRDRRPVRREVGSEIFISVPVTLATGDYAGNLCALDTRPNALPEARLRLIFNCFARLVGQQLDLLDARRRDPLPANGSKVLGNLRGLFLAMLAHDLQEPLGDVASASEQLETKSWDPAMRQLAARVKAQTKKMSSLIDDVLVHARTPTGTGMPVQVREVSNLSDVLEAAVASLSAVHPDRTLISNILIDRPVHCDPGKIRQLTSNLLNNALANGGPAGPVSITARIKKHDLFITVWNDGNVISQEVIKSVFKPFWRQEPDRSPMRLGLHLCHEIVRAHLGTIRVTSSPDKGTQFVARIPLSLTPAAD